MIAAGVRHGLVVVAARTRTRDYRETVPAGEEGGVEVWGTVPERVAVAAGLEGPSEADAMEAYRGVLAAATGAEALR